MNQLEKALINDLSGQGIKGNIRIELIGEKQELLKAFYYGNANLNQVKIANVNTRNGYFSASVEILPYMLQHSVTVLIQGEYEKIVSVPVVRNKVLKGDIITRENISVLERNTRQIKGDVITHIDELVGKMAKRNILPGNPISARVVSEPVVVKKGYPVAMIYHTPAIRLRTIGIALDEGSKGMLIPVRNTSSGVIVHAEVLDRNVVEIPGVEAEGGNDGHY